MKKLISSLFFIIFILSPFYAQDENTEAGSTYYEEEYAQEEYYEEEYYEDEEYAEEVVEVVENVETPITPVAPPANATVVNTGPQTNITIPIFSDYKLPMRINLTNPLLPSMHQFKKLRGTVWRGSERIVRANKRGVLSEQRLFIFFDQDRDAIAYSYATYNSKRIPNTPRREHFIPLFPLLITNSYVPIVSSNLHKVSSAASTNTTNSGLNIILKVEPSLAGANPDGTLLPKTPIVPTPPTLATPTAPVVPTPVQEIAEEAIYEEGAYEEDVYEEGTYEEGVYEEGAYEEGVYEEGAYEEEYEGEEEAYAEYDDFVNPDELYNAYEEELGETASLKRRPLRFFAQNVIPVTTQPTTNKIVTNLFSTLTNQYVINVGGNDSGIFIHETKNPRNPFKVIFLHLDKGMTLYEYNLDNSFDVRDGQSQTSIRARELYLNILGQKINMKKFQRMYIPTDYISE